MAVRPRDNYLSEAQLEVMKSFDAGWKGYTPRYQMVFNVETDPKRLTEKFSVRGGMSQSFVAKSDGAAYNQQNPKIVGTQTISELIFKEAVSLTKMMKKKDNYRSAMEDANRLGYLARLKMDKLGADVIGGAAASTVTWDGLFLADTGHLIGDTGSTQDNLITGGLSTANFESAFQNFALQKDHNGSVMSLVPKAVIFPTRNKFQIKKILGSPMTPEDANTSMNALKDENVLLIEWPQMVTTEFEAMILSASAMHRLEYLVHYGPELTPERDPNTGNDMVQLDLSCNAGAVDYLGTYFITT